MKRRMLLRAARVSDGRQSGSVTVKHELSSGDWMLQCGLAPHTSRTRDESMSRESLEFDVVIVGAGPAGLAAGCRLGQLAREHGAPLSVAIVEKGAAIGSHIVS